MVTEAAKKAVKEGSEDLQREVKSTIEDQKEAWPALSRSTLEAKAPETRALVDSGDMVGSIGIRAGADDYTKTIGVHNDKTESHRAARNEFGDPADNIPERSFIRSTAERVQRGTVNQMKRTIKKAID